jgi:ribonucleoside-triphosphate reductase
MGSAGSGARVVKGSGETEVFDPNVITSDCVEAGIEFWTAAEIALEVSNEIFDGINSEEIQRKILSALYNRNPEVAERYKRFHSMYVRSSSNTIERFDRKRIADSLVKETSLPKEVAEIIAKETESELRRLNLDFTSGPLIREIVNVKLLEHGYEGARSDYTRLGMPVYDAAQFIESPRTGIANLGSADVVRKSLSNNIYREYALLKILPLHLADAHMKGDIHINKLEYFVTRPYTGIHDMRFFLKGGLNFESSEFGASVSGPAKNAQSAILQGVKALTALCSNFSSNQGLHFFNLWLSPYLAGLNSTEIYQLAQMCIFEISQTYPLSGKGSPSVDLEIDFSIPEEIGKISAVLPGGSASDVIYSDFEEEAREFAWALARVYCQGDYRGAGFRTPRLIFKIRDQDVNHKDYADFKLLLHEAGSKHREVNLLNLSSGGLSPSTSAHSSGLMFQLEGSDFSSTPAGLMNPSSLQCITLNLPRIAYRAGGSDENFFETLDEMLAISREVFAIKREVLSKRIDQGLLPLLSQNLWGEAFFDLENSYAQEFGESILNHIHKTLSSWGRENHLNWAIASVSHSTVARRFALLDSGQFSESPFASGKHASADIHYSDSYQLANQAKLSLVERQKIQHPFQSLSTGGFLENIKVKKESAEELEEISNQMLRNRVGFWSFKP